MDILDKKTYPIHALAQPRKGFIYGNFLPHRVAHINLLDNLWLIDGHF